MNAWLNSMGVVCALGVDSATVREALFAEQLPNVDPDTTVLPGCSLHVARADIPLAGISQLPTEHRSRTNVLLLAALAQIRPQVEEARERYGAARIGIVLGTSTSGIDEASQAILQARMQGKLPLDFHCAQQELGSPALLLAELLELSGPAIVVSTACSSSAKAMASAARLLQADMCDAVICGGMDSLCAFTVAGFSALESVSPARCNPMSANRCGINIGDGGALFLMSREVGPVRLTGWGEGSDAYHLSAPDPTGGGALAAMQAALNRAGLRPEQIDYINLHGTATLQNDAMESAAISQLFGTDIPASSTKPLTGHALGGAGALEAALCWLSLQDNPRGLLPPHWWDGVRDPALPGLALCEPGSELGRPLRRILSNSFAFGGSNCALVLEANDA